MATERGEPRRWVYLFFIIIIGAVFVLQFGPGSKGCDAPLPSTTSSSAAVVNGKEIPVKTYRDAYRNQLDNFRERGQPIPDAMAQQLGIPKRVLDGLVESELVSQAAEKQGVTVSNDEMATLIHNTPAFQVNGQFDEPRYRQVLREYTRQTYQEYETQLRRQLSGQRLLELVTASAQVSDDEVKSRFLKEGNQANATLVRFLPQMFVDKVAKPTPAELATFKRDHAKDIADYYTQNKFQYHQAERVKARHILVKVDKDATAEVKDAAKAKAEALRKEITGGKDFATVAKASSEDVGSKAQGGELGFNERQSWVPEFADAAFKLKNGEISEPVLSPFGYHLIQAEEKKPAEDRTLPAATDEIATLLVRKAKAQTLAKAEADKALAALKKGTALKTQFPPSSEKTAGQMSFETESKPEASETGTFSQMGDSVPQLGPAGPLASDLFATSAPQPLDKVYAVGEGYVVGQVTERKRPTDDAFAKEKTALKDQTLKARQDELRESYVKALRKSATITLNPDLTKGTQEPS